MGLDMYLHLSTYVKRQEYSEENGVRVTVPNTSFFDIVNAAGAASIVDTGEQAWLGIDLKIPVGYWRKANAIHGWFIRNCAYNRDDCQDVTVTWENAQELLDTCREVKANPEKATELLPPVEGFFFGTYEIDEWYWDAVDRTIQILERVLAHADELGAWDSLIYRASW